MANISSVNGVVCADIGSIDGIAKVDISLFDGIPFCADVSPTPTPTNTPTPQPTPTPTPTPVCVPECCPAELCFSKRDCTDACLCNDVQPYFLHLPCGGDCLLSNADGIFTDSDCLELADAGYYVDSSAECWYWDGSSSLSFDTNCR
jgi:hypothetical protein